MALIRPSVLWLATAMSTPAIYRYVTGDLDITTTLIRFLLAVPIAAVMLAGLGVLTAGYGSRRPALNLASRRRRSDEPAEAPD